MRTIKFRAKDFDGVWHYGSLVYTNILDAKIYSQTVKGSLKITDWLFVTPDTIGQFTGLYDKNGKEIYEGDIILYRGSIQHEVVFRHGAFGYLLYGGEFISCAGNTNFTFNPLNRSKEHEVIGNIYDNPELKKK